MGEKNIVYSTNTDFDPKSIVSPKVKYIEKQDFRIHLIRLKGGKVITVIRGYKGNLKNTIGEDIVTPDVNLPRYHQLAVLIREYKPKRIVEVGTWNGGRAIEMALAAFENSKRVHYTGFDLFEDATFEIDRKEQNTKPHNNFDAVKKRLEDFADKMKEDKKAFTFTLLKGDSKV